MELEVLRKDMVAAMKAGEKEKKETLSMLLAALKNKQIDKRADLTEEEEIQVIMKEIKQTKETLEMTPADRTDIIEECNRRLTVLEAYAPKMMGEDEIKVSQYGQWIVLDGIRRGVARVQYRLDSYIHMTRND